MAMFDPSDFDSEVEEEIEAVTELNLEPEQEQQSLQEAPADEIDENGSRKRPKMEEQDDEETTLVDRISDLPDGILLHILSLLPSTKEVIRTGALSKRWQFLWNTVPKLLFIKDLFEKEFLDSDEEYDYYEEDTTETFVSNASKTLIQCRHSKLNAFHVRFKYESRFAAQLNEWIRYAVSCNVEELYLNVVPAFNRAAHDGARYELPQHLFSNSLIIDLRLRSVIFMPMRDINWKVLKRLKLWDVKLTEDVIQNISRGSPCLEILIFHACNGFRRVEITSLSVKKLTINRLYLTNGNDPNVFEVSAPNISSLEMEGAFMSTKIRLVNLRSLVEAKVSCYISRIPGNATSQEKAQEELWMGILESLHHVNTLVVGAGCIMALSRLELQGWCAPLSRRKCLKIQSFVRRRGFPGLVNLLESSPELETLTIGVDNPSRYSCGSYTRKNYLAVQRKSFKCLQLHVKTVRIAFFIQWDHQCELVQFLLENGDALEKIIVCVRSLDCKDLNFVSKGLPEVTKKLLSYPKASKDAVVIFKD